MKKHKKKPIIAVEARINSEGDFDVVTSFLGNTVGNYLGPCDDLSESDAIALAKKWEEFQGKNDAAENMKQIEAKKSKYLKDWDVPVEAL